MFNINCFVDYRKMKGKDAPSDFSGKLPGVHKYTLGGEMDVTVTVNNVLVDTEIHNVFGVIKGFTDPGEDLDMVLHIVLTSESVFSEK